MAGTTPPDLATVWRDAMRDWETQTNAAMTRLSGAESFAAPMNQLVAGVAKAQSAYGEAVEQALIRLNLPNRADLRGLAAKLDDIERKLDAIAARLDGAAEGAAPEPASAFPPRTKKAKRAEGES